VKFQQQSRWVVVQNAAVKCAADLHARAAFGVESFGDAADIQDAMEFANPR
jgi:hypothetical protein